MKRRRQPKAVARVLFGVSQLPVGHYLWRVSERFMFELLAECRKPAADAPDMHRVARILGVSVRQAQRLVVAFYGAQR